MALQPTFKPERYEFLIIIEGENSVDAQALSGLISALAKDYRAISGRRLTISRIIRGSYWLYIADLIALSLPYAGNAVEIARGTKSIIEFGKTIRETIGSKKNIADSGNVNLQEATLKSVEAILKIADKNQSYVKFRQTNSDGSFIEAEISPTEARAVRRTKPVKAENKTFKSKTRAIAPTSKHLTLPAPRDIAGRFESLMNTDPASAEKMIEVFISLIKQRGNDYILHDLATELDIMGYSVLADKVRSEIDDGKESVTVEAN